MSNIQWGYIGNEILRTWFHTALAFCVLCLYVSNTMPALLTFFIERSNVYLSIMSLFGFAAFLPLMDGVWKGCHIDSYTVMMWFQRNPSFYNYVAGVKCVMYVEEEEIAFYRNGACIFSVDRESFSTWEVDFTKETEWMSEAMPIKIEEPDSSIIIPIC